MQGRSITLHILSWCQEKHRHLDLITYLQVISSHGGCRRTVRVSGRTSSRRLQKSVRVYSRLLRTSQRLASCSPASISNSLDTTYIKIPFGLWIELHVCDAKSPPWNVCGFILCCSVCDFYRALWTSGTQPFLYSHCVVAPVLWSIALLAVSSENLDNCSVSLQPYIRIERLENNLLPLILHLSPPRLAKFKMYRTYTPYSTYECWLLYTMYN